MVITIEKVDLAILLLVIAHLVLLFTSVTSSLSHTHISHSLLLLNHIRQPIVNYLIIDNMCKSVCVYACILYFHKCYIYIDVLVSGSKTFVGIFVQW